MLSYESVICLWFSSVTKTPNPKYGKPSKYSTLLPVRTDWHNRSKSHRRLLHKSQVRAFPGPHPRRALWFLSLPWHHPNHLGGKSANLTPFCVWFFTTVCFTEFICPYWWEYVDFYLGWPSNVWLSWKSPCDHFAHISTI